MRVGLLTHGFVGWGGGMDFLRLVASSLHATGEPIELHALLPMKGPLYSARQTLRRLRAVLRPTPPAPDRAAIIDAIESFDVPLTVHEIDRGSRALQSSYRRLQLDVMLPALDALYVSPEIPWVGYLYDFQHRHLPQLFNARDIAERDRAFRNVLQAAPAIVVNSRAVAADAEKFVPESRGKLFALPFSPAPSADWFSDEPPPLERYGIVAPYFIVCNQFWKHKDHGTVIRAMALLAREVPSIQLVCTGEAHDYRDSTYFPALMREAQELGVADRLRVLGRIPKADQIALLRAAVALIQPTLFEGGPGGGAVYDAVSLGVPAIASDIPVNLEIDDPSVSFFPCGNAQALAQAMQHALTIRPSAPDPSALVERGKLRRKASGKVLLQAIAKARSAASTLRER